MFAFYAAQCRLGAPALFSDKPVADMFDPTIVSVKKAVEKHHLFPRQWLLGKGIDDRKMTDQVANFSFVEWSENIKISDEAPSDYVTRIRSNFDASSWEKMMHLHALPQDWEHMDYPDFLETRRPLLARVIRRGLESLVPDVEPVIGTFYTSDGTKGEQEVWLSIANLEKRLRTIVMKSYSDRWGAKAEVKIREFLGEAQSLVINKNREKGEKKYPLADKTSPPRNVLDYAYLGQLSNLMQTKHAWEMFREPFKDKRHLADLMNAIVPVRNDTAHFRSVPEKELMRCRVALSDLGVLLDSLP